MLNKQSTTGGQKQSSADGSQIHAPAITFPICIERWTRQSDSEVHRRSIPRDNIVSAYGWDGKSRIADPADLRCSAGSQHSIYLPLVMRNSPASPGRF